MYSNLSLEVLETAQLTGPLILSKFKDAISQHRVLSIDDPGRLLNWRERYVGREDR